MSSRFFQGGASDSEYSSSEEELLSSSDEELVSSEDEQDNDEDDGDLSDDSAFAGDDDNESESDDDDGDRRGPSYFLKKSFLKGADSEDESDEDTKKVVKSGRDKLLDELKNSISGMENASVIGDWVTTLAEFDSLSRTLTRGKQHIGIPNIYIRAISDLDQSITKASAEEKDSKKKLNASTAKAFNTMKQRIKKAVREQSELIEAFRETPEAFEKDDAPATTQASKAATPVPSGAQGGASTGTGVGARSAQSAALFLALRAVIESRGKKNVDVAEQIKLLESLIQEATAPYDKIVVYLQLIQQRFDNSANFGYMPLDQWHAAAKDINDFFQILEDNIKSYQVVETATVNDEIEVEPKPNAQGVCEILGSVVSFVERLDDEFTRSLQIIDPHTTEYIDRLRDEQLIYTTIIRAQLYSEAIIPQSQLLSSPSDQIPRILRRRIDHIYYKQTTLIKVAEAAAWEILPKSLPSSYIQLYNDAEDYPDKLMDSLASVLYKQSNSSLRKQAMLSHIYYYAFNNQYFKARDMFLMSHLQSSIHTSDANLQTLFNRALVQLGLCAFRNGLIFECHQTLQEITNSQRHKELLGQGAQRYNNQASNTEKQRYLPYHTHINLELLESVFLTCSLLIEIPQNAQMGSNGDQKRLQNRMFRRTLDFHERQTFQGPPEHTKDYIMHAAKALQSGDWKKAVELLNSIKIWNLFPESDKLRAMIKEKLQTEGLRTYLFQFKSFYSKLSIVKLSKTFELPESKVSAVVSKMIFNEEIAAGLDQVSNSIIFTKGVELTQLQTLALQLSDKVQSLSERNERLSGSHQQQGYSGHHHNNHHHNSGSDGQRQNRHHNKNSNFKFAPVTGALSSAPATISGALNGMDKRKNKGAKAN